MTLLQAMAIIRDREREFHRAALDGHGFLPAALALGHSEETHVHLGLGLVRLDPNWVDFIRDGGPTPHTDEDGNRYGELTRCILTGQRFDEDTQVVLRTFPRETVHCVYWHETGGRSDA
jgi:hypothetical protein